MTQKKKDTPEDNDAYAAEASEKAFIQVQS